MERSIDDARSRIPLNAEQVQSVISEMEARTKSKAARVAMAKAAIRIGNVTPEAIDVWRAYLARLTER
jgi:hypothetical protein